MIIIWTNLVQLDSSMLYTKIQPPSFHGSGGEDFQDFLPYMDMAAILFNCEESSERIRNPFQQIAHVKSGESCSRSFREEDI